MRSIPNFQNVITSFKRTKHYLAARLVPVLLEMLPLFPVSLEDLVDRLCH